MIRALTLALLALPVVLGVAFLRQLPAQALWIPGSIALLYLATWLWWRPNAFELDAGGLTIRWPLRRRRIPWREIREARAVEACALRAELGFAARIGVGGLWGGFGWLWTRRRGMLDMYVSRTDGLLMLERLGGHPLLITPEHPDEFSRAVARHVQGVAPAQ